jgi:hypothetical protein
VADEITISKRQAERCITSCGRQKGPKPFELSAIWRDFSSPGRASTWVVPMTFNGTNIFGSSTPGESPRDLAWSTRLVKVDPSVLCENAKAHACANQSDCDTARWQMPLEAARSRGGLCLSEECINSKSKLLWQCGKGHRWSPSDISRIRRLGESSEVVGANIRRRSPWRTSSDATHDLHAGERNENELGRE